MLGAEFCLNEVQPQRHFFYKLCCTPPFFHKSRNRVPLKINPRWIYQNLIPEASQISNQECFDFDPASFVMEKVEAIRGAVGKSRAAIATSGGVDSTACAVLAHRALGKELICFFLDTGFMREGEVEEVRQMLTSLDLPLKVLSVRDRFIAALKGKTDAESKRLAFRQTFYTVLGEAVRSEGCEVLIQGTIAPDWIETSGGIKTQHNVLEQLGVNTMSSFGFRLLEPLLDLYKDQVRALARYLGVKASERQPFPGPGLMVRCIGEVTEEKLDVLRRATTITEAGLSRMASPPKQYLAAVAEDERTPGDAVTAAADGAVSGATVGYLSRLATGVKGDDRAYGKMAVVSLPPGEAGEKEPRELFELPPAIIHADRDVVRVLYAIAQARLGGIKRNVSYAILIRAVETRDFMTAKPSEVPLHLLKGMAKTITEDDRVSLVAYDITSKPPATVEFE